MLRTLLLLCALTVAGCGFQPVHSQGQGADSARATAASVRVQPVKTRIVRAETERLGQSDRTGQIVHNALVARLNPRGQPRDPAYVLDLEIRELVRRTGFRLDETATRANLELEARYVLRDAETREVVGRGRARSINSANILDQPYATTVAERDARERGATDIADQIARDVMSRLATAQ